MDLSLSSVQESNEFLNTLFTNVSSSIFIADGNAHIQHVNNSFEKLFQKEAEEVQGKLCGNALGCYYTVAESKDCGTTSYCSQCNLRKSILDAILDKEATNNKIISREFEINDKLVHKYFRFNTRPIKFRDEDLALIIVDDLTYHETQKNEIEESLNEVRSRSHAITESIEYAKNIQRAMLPTRKYLNSILEEYFLFFKPRDIVSGDFYFIREKNNKLLVIAADCTGHGVPGGFMSMLGISTLNDISNRMIDSNHYCEINAADLLNLLRDQIIGSLNQRNKKYSLRDGMDVALYILDKETHELSFSGAMNSLYIVRKGELIILKADKAPVGMHDLQHLPFTNHTFKVEQGDMIYSFSDGYTDQFGGEKGKKYMIKRLKPLLVSASGMPIKEQKKLIAKTFYDWMGDIEQVDDVIMIAYRVPQIAKSVPRSPIYEWQNNKILVIEDREENFFFLSESLEETGIEITHVKTGEEAVEIIESNTSFNLVLADIMLPGISGFETITRIKKHCPTIPIIAHSAMIGPENYDRCLEAGAVDFIAKPVKKATLLKKLGQYF